MSRREPEYFPHFDWLRLVLASAVVFSHDGLIGWPRAGNLAVQVFFALSGWLIGGILIDLKRAELPRFLFNRAARIWVPYYITLAVVVALSLVRDPITTKWLEFVIYKITFTYNWYGPPQLAEFRDAMPLKASSNHLWSVNAEEQFYLIAPLLMVLLPKRVGCSPLLWTVVAAGAWWTDAYASIALGVLASTVAARWPNAHLNARGRIGLVALAMLSAFALAEDLDYARWSPVFSVALVLLLAIPGVPTASGRFAGGISYSLYLNHWIGVFIANAVLKPAGLHLSMLRPAIGYLAGVLIASAIYWYVERRVLDARGRHFTPMRGMMCAVSAYGLIAVGVLLASTVFRR